MRPSTSHVLAVLLVVATPAWASEAPMATPADARIRVIDYDPWRVVKIEGAFRTATQILFGDDETILHVAVGDATGWDVAAERNILFVKPKAAHGTTNLIVTTRRGAGVRNYAFELELAPGRRGAATPAYVLRFRYPQEAQAVAAAAISAEARRMEAVVLQLNLDHAAVEGPRNLGYAVQGATDLQPTEVSDNGRFTVLRFPGTQAIPAVYVVDAAGIEALAAFDVRGAFVVVHGVARQLRLRRGREVLCIFNQAYSPYGADPGTGTATPQVRRIEKAAP